MCLHIKTCTHIFFFKNRSIRCLASSYWYCFTQACRSYPAEQVFAQMQCMHKALAERYDKCCIVFGRETVEGKTIAGLQRMTNDA